MQDKQPIAIYSQNLNTAQKRYTTTERKLGLLSAIETCKEYKNILLGSQTIRIIPPMTQKLQTAFFVQAGFYSLKNMK
jgi:hypothetical protein